MDKIAANRLDRGFQQYQGEFEDAALGVLRSGWYVLGKEVAAFESEFANYIGTKYCVGLASGLDALWLAFQILGIGRGDEVIVQGNAYIASVMGITMNGATPVFVEPDKYFNINTQKIEEKITKQTKAILVVHLYGQTAKMEDILLLTQKYHLKLVEDCAQSHGACFNGQMAGTFGDVGCFSFYPSKNLGAFGDGGAIVTNQGVLNRDFRIYRNYGSEKRYYNKVVGTNSRLDEIQAALLRVRLKHIHEIESERINIAGRYGSGIKNDAIILPKIREKATSVWHQYVIRCHERNRLKEYLDDKGVNTLIHYPIPPHLSEAYSYLNIKKGTLPVTEQYADEVLSLPMYTGMTEREQESVIETINHFC